MVACLMVCKQCGYQWATVGTRQGRAIVLKAFTGEPGGPNDPTCCAKCHSSNVGLQVIDDIPVMAGEQPPVAAFSIPHPGYQSVNAEFEHVASLWDGLLSEA